MTSPAESNPSKRPHGGQGKGIRGKNVCRRCGAPYDGVTSHGPGHCGPQLAESNPRQQHIYKSVIKVNLADPPGHRARDIADGIGYACALLRDEYGWDIDAIVGLLEQTMNEAEAS